MKESSRFCRFEVCLLLCALAGGCHKPVSTDFVAPPGLQPGLLEQGDTLQWIASGQPFAIEFLPSSPCDETPDKLVNHDGKTNLTCHLRIDAPTGYYAYRYVARATKHSSEAPPKEVTGGPFALRVISCTACQVITKPIGTQSPDARVKATVYLYCLNGTATADSSPTANTVNWRYLGGEIPSGADPFKVSIKSGACSNYTSGTDITSSSASCTVQNNFTYTFTVNSCAAGGNANITLAK
jgi:hypothetical protein